MRTLKAPAALILAVAVLAGGCSAEQTPEQTPAKPERPQPVIKQNFPDPDLLEVDGTYYAYATNDNARNVQVASSTDLQEWEMLPDALPDLPSWIIPNKTWAPEVTEVSPGSFVMYFTATNFQPSLQCIGVATATDPAGPFEVQGDEMLVCPEDQGGAIDASTFVDDDGTLYLLWKNDGNCCGQDTWLQMAPLSSDGLTLAGPTRKLIMQTEEWEGHVVEAPTMVKRDDTYVLLYSANSYTADLYAIGYASAPSLDGPWTKLDGPWLSTEASDGRYLGPGGQDLVTGPDGSELLAFHAWDPAFTIRPLYLLPVTWDGATLSPILDG